MSIDNVEYLVSVKRVTEFKSIICNLGQLINEKSLVLKSNSCGDNHYCTNGNPWSWRVPPFFLNNKTNSATDEFIVVQESNYLPPTFKEDQNTHKVEKNNSNILLERKLKTNDIIVEVHSFVLYKCR